MSIGREPTPGHRRGDVHFVTFAETGGNVLFGPHPAIIVQSDSMARSSTVIVAPMTSRARSGHLAPPYLVAVGARESGLDRDGWVKVDQLFTVPTAQLSERVGRLSPKRLEDLDRALLFVLGLRGS